MYKMRQCVYIGMPRWHILEGQMGKMIDKLLFLYFSVYTVNI